MATSKKNCIVIGGGYTGLTAAYALAASGHTVTLIERDDHLGGLATGFTQPSWLWPLERSYHHLFTNDSAIQALAKDLGISDSFRVYEPRTATYHHASINQLDSAVSLLRYPYLPFIDRIRTGMLLAYCKLTPWWKPLESVTAKDFFTTWGGLNGWREIWEPLMKGKFGTYTDRIAASWLWARIYKRTPSLIYPDGSFSTIVDALEHALRSRGVTIHTGTTVTAVRRTKKTDGWSVSYQSKTAKKTIHSVESVLFTVPSPIATTLVPFPKKYVDQLRSIPHLSAQTFILETAYPILDRTYWLNVNDRSFPFLAVVAHTNLIDPSNYGNRHITYIGNYIPPDHPYLSMTKKEILTLFWPYLRKINPTLPAQPALIASHLFAAPFAQPIHEIHYSSRAPIITTPIDGIFIANLDSVFPWDRGTNYAVEMGMKAAEIISSQ
jgi:protoporphyrinogen oxidase